MVEPGFVKGQSDNLPKVDDFMIAHFFSNNSNFISPEMKGVKALRSTREEYRSNAVGWVQVKRLDQICTVKARITPEHRVRSSAYKVCLEVDEAEDEIKEVKCFDCAASQGGCKHTMAFLFWVHEESKKASVTSVQCYWKKSKMAEIGTSKKFIYATDIGKQKQCESVDIGQSVLDDVVNQLVNHNIKNTLSKYFKEDELNKVSIHHMMIYFKLETQIANQTPKQFLKYCRKNMTNNICQKISNSTLDQCKSNLWYEIRYGRITASKINETTKCKSFDGSLVQSIFGSRGFKGTDATRRGLELEPKVVEHVAKKKNIIIHRSGILISGKYPIFGASPDGISIEYIIEVKCPTSIKSMENYIRNNQVVDKFKSQMQLQMGLAKKEKGLFCVADPEFEKNNKVSIIEVHFNENLFKQEIKLCEEFWKSAIFPKLILI